jgi:hypothetical protein
MGVPAGRSVASLGAWQRASDMRWCRAAGVGGGGEPAGDSSLRAPHMDIPVARTFRTLFFRSAVDFLSSQ